MDNKDNKTKKRRSLYTSEIVLYSIFGTIWLTGFVLAILGMIANNVGTLSTSPLYNAQKSFAHAFGQANGMFDFRIVGTIFIAFALICFLISIFAYSARYSNEQAKERRRQERMKILMEDDNNKK